MKVLSTIIEVATGEEVKIVLGEEAKMTIGEEANMANGEANPVNGNIPFNIKPIHAIISDDGNKTPSGNSTPERNSSPNGDNTRDRNSSGINYPPTINPAYLTLGGFGNNRPFPGTSLNANNTPVSNNNPNTDNTVDGVNNTANSRKRGFDEVNPIVLDDDENAPSSSRKRGRYHSDPIVLDDDENNPSVGNSSAVNPTAANPTAPYTTTTTAYPPAPYPAPTSLTPTTPDNWRPGVLTNKVYHPNHENKPGNPKGLPGLDPHGFLDIPDVADQAFKYYFRPGQTNQPFATRMAEALELYNDGEYLNRVRLNTFNLDWLISFMKYEQRESYNKLFSPCLQGGYPYLSKVKNDEELRRALRNTP